ncbi:TetR/AcrR family transcriptional regulator [Micromonospora sp. NPDC049523]|uniref:TetR/AcrR family transcriptional regulator n=1 Tax=Micromonospora sp. NPDC049523 TaxID=3155921 RepID=UPI00341688B4
MPAPGSSEKSDQRRQVVLDAAVTCFARKGFYGTTTNEIAERAGISQPYVYRLFANKQTLFAHAVFHVSELMANTLAAYVAEAGPIPQPPEVALRTARSAYSALIQDRDVLRFLMHANCAADEPLVGDAVRWCYAKQVELVSKLVGSDEAVRQWFGAGMLENVTTALGLADIDEPWAHTLSGR